MKIVLTEDEALAISKICKDLPKFPLIVNGKPATRLVGKIGQQLITMCRENNWKEEVQGKKIKPKKKYIYTEEVLSDPIHYMSLSLRKDGIANLPAALKQYLAEYKTYQLWAIDNNPTKID